ncbi:MAG: sodium:solute symporter family protein [Gemmatimonadales bacterium]
MNTHLLLLLAYSVGLVLLGLWIGRRVATSGAFFVAGRRLGPVLLFATVLAANIGAGSTVGAAGLGYRDGLAAWWWVGSAGIGTLFLALWLGPRIWRIARERGLYTVGDYLELRYGASVRATVAILLWVGTLAILAGQLIAVAWILDVVAGVPKVWGCLIGGGVMTVYFAAGGLVTSAWVNLVQLVVLWGGFALALPLVLSDAGGWGAIVQAAPAAAGQYFGFFEGGGSGWTYLILLAPAFIISPGLIQKVYGARDERAIRLGVGLSGVALLVFAAVPPLLGMMARAYAPDLVQHELALPTVLTEALPAAFGSLALAAVFSAEISSADAILFMLSTSLSEDLYKRFVHPSASDARVLSVARVAAVAGGGFGVMLAIVLPSVIDSLTIFYTLLSVSLFVPVAVGIHTRRPGVAEAVGAVLGGVGLVVVVRLAGLERGVWNASTLGLIASAATFLLVLAIRRLRATD